MRKGDRLTSDKDLVVCALLQEVPLVALILTFGHRVCPGFCNIVVAERRAIKEGRRRWASLKNDRWTVRPLVHA